MAWRTWLRGARGPRRLAVALTATLTVAAPLTALAARTAGWTLEPFPHPSANPVRELLGVSCPAVRFCVAVGIDRAAGLGATPSAFTAHWDGTAWSADPTGALGGGLDALSCVSRRFCLSVGYAALAERWDGARWWPVSRPRIARGAELDGVSCRSASFCVAVGGEPGGALGRAVAVVWDGRGWTRARVPPVPGADVSVLHGVSCVSRTRCLAVGEWYSSRTAERGAVAARWNGRSWRLQPLPRGTGALGLSAISCRTVSFCMAVGGPSDGDEGQVLAERWDGSRFSRIPLAASGSNLQAVACGSTRMCVAVGAAHSRTLAERWNGRRWMRTPTRDMPRPSDAVPELGWSIGLSAVSCATPDVCDAVGSLEYHPGGSITEWAPVAERYR